MLANAHRFHPSSNRLCRMEYAPHTPLSVGRQALAMTTMSLAMFQYSNGLVSAYKQCLDMRGEETGFFKSSTSGLMASLIAMHVCDHVTVFGIGEPPLDGSQYQVSSAPFRIGFQ